MILKIEDTQCGKTHGWRFVEVEDVKKTSSINEEPDSIHWVRLELLKGSGKEVYDTFILSSEQVYLMNNEGKTIERLN